MILRGSNLYQLIQTSFHALILGQIQGLFR
jgi:hypothetical protein